MIDLHAHTMHSDGADEVSTLLKLAQAKQLSHFSITDHNTVEGYFHADMQQLDELYTGVLIPGIEITCMFEQEIIEVLGYGIDLVQMRKRLPEIVLSFEEKQQREFALICSAFEAAGVTFRREDIHFDPKKESCRKAFMKHLQLFEENLPFFSHEASRTKSSSFSRNEIYNPNSRLFVDESPLYPSAKDAVALIHACGGISCMAHLFVYAHAAEFRARLWSIVQELQLDGMECAHSAFEPAQILDLEQFCDQHRLLKSGGSDYHGARRPDYDLQRGRGQLAISENYLERWPSQALVDVRRRFS